MFDEGDVVLLDEQAAELINSDSPGVLVPVVPDSPKPEVEGRALSGPPQHRAVLTADQERVSEEPVEATDAAVRLADELGLDLSTIQGTGAGGKITKGDVERAK
jgi:pyruvate/2-oxoglutarate dehydrogenase complex dihydrolipoamide acyltransferase (E2) component